VQCRTLYWFPLHFSNLVLYLVCYLLCHIQRARPGECIHLHHTKHFCTLSTRIALRNLSSFCMSRRECTCTMASASGQRHRRSMQIQNLLLRVPVFLRANGHNRTDNNTELAGLHTYLFANPERGASRHPVWRKKESFVPLGSRSQPSQPAQPASQPVSEQGRDQQHSAQNTTSIDCFRVQLSSKRGVATPKETRFLSRESSAGKRAFCQL
jgi:hypothetical protein